MTTRITVDLEEITWGELIAFVDAARAIQVSESDKVIQISDLLDDVTVTAFELILPRPLPQNWRSVSSELAEEIRTILTLISQGDGDIRELLPQVRALNDSLSWPHHLSSDAQYVENGGGHNRPVHQNPA